MTVEDASARTTESPDDVVIRISRSSDAAKSSAVLDRLKSSWWFAWIAAIVLALSQVKDVVDSLDKLLVFVGAKPDALALGRAIDKGTLSRDLTEAAWRRLFWARAFQGRVARGAPQAEIDEAWKNWIASSEAWSERVMVYIVGTDAFYGRDKAQELEQGVQRGFLTLESSLIAIRYAHNEAPPQERQVMLQNAKTATDEINSVLYRLVRGMAPPGFGQPLQRTTIPG